MSGRRVVRSRRRPQRGQTLIVFALGFALFLFGLTCLVADSAYLYAWSGRTEAAAQLAAQSGADSVDPQFLYGCVSPAAPSCHRSIVDTSETDRSGSLYAFQRACIQAGDQSAQVPSDPPGDLTPKSAAAAQTPDGTACASDGCRVFAVVSRTVQLPIPFPGFPDTVVVRGKAYAAPVVGTTRATSVCAGTGWVPAPPSG